MAKTFPSKIGLSHKPELQDLPDPWLTGLVQDKLTAQDRLSLFGASKATAAMVARQADSIQLTLSREHEGDEGSAQLQARLDVLQTILEAAWETPMYVVLQSPRQFPYKGHLPVRWGVVPKSSVVSLTLQGANLAVTLTTTYPGPSGSWEPGSPQKPAQALNPGEVSSVPVRRPYSLSLQECLWLHTLVLGEDCYWTSFCSITTLLQGHKLWAPPALSCLDIHSECRMTAASIMLQLLGPQLSHFYYNNQLPDGLLVTLMQQPKLTHVSACSLDIQLDHTHGYMLQDEPMLMPGTGGDGQFLVPVDQEPQQKVFKWEQLQLKKGAHVEALLRLPLQNIKQLVIRGFLNYGGKEQLGDQEVQHLARSPSLQCVPLQHDIQGFAEPLFAVTGNVGTALLRMCINGLTTACALYLCDCTRASMTSLLPCLRQLPTTVVALGFGLAGKGPLQHPDGGQRAQYWHELLSVLPAHVKRLLLQPLNATAEEVDHCFLHVSSLLEEIAGNPTSHDRVVYLVLAKDGQSRQLKAVQRKYPRKLKLLRF